MRGRFALHFIAVRTRFQEYAHVVKIRLARFGSKKNPHYRIVVADSRSPRDGRSIETIGTYNPQTDPSSIMVKNDRAEYWVGVGAQPSERVAKLLKIAGVAGV
jgi:small subunit ribosomal protein S16